MTITIYEYSEQDARSGDAIYPPQRISRAAALDAVHALDLNTQLVEIFAPSAVHLSIAASAILATTADRRLDAATTVMVTLKVAPGVRTYISATAAS